MKTSQVEVIKNHLEEYGQITSTEAFKKYSITRLSNVIYTLRHAGMIIDTEHKTHRNKYGNSVNYGIYRLMPFKKPKKVEIANTKVSSQETKKAKNVSKALKETKTKVTKNAPKKATKKATKVAPVKTEKTSKKVVKKAPIAKKIVPLKKTKVSKVK